MILTTLAQMQLGAVGCVRGFYAGSRSYRQKLLTMGLTPNTRFEVVRRAPLGDPVQIRLRDYSLSIRQSEACVLKIELLEQGQ